MNVQSLWHRNVTKQLCQWLFYGPVPCMVLHFCTCTRTKFPYIHQLLMQCNLIVSIFYSSSKKLIGVLWNLEIMDQWWHLHLVKQETWQILQNQAFNLNRTLFINKCLNFFTFRRWCRDKHFLDSWWGRKWLSWLFLGNLIYIGEFFFKKTT